MPRIMTQAEQRMRRCGAGTAAYRLDRPVSRATEHGPHGWRPGPSLRDDPPCPVRHALDPDLRDGLPGPLQPRRVVTLAASVLVLLGVLLLPVLAWALGY